LRLGATVDVRSVGRGAGRARNTTFSLDRGAVRLREWVSHPCIALAPTRTGSARALDR
jgi:hypothetical protein